MKHIFLPLLALVSVTLHAQNADSSSAKKSDGRVMIPGTHVSMVLPAGFKLAKEFNGIEKDDKTYIQIFDPYDTSYNASSSSFSRPIFENQGMDVFIFKAMNVGKFAAKYAGMKSSTGLRKYELLFGDTGFSAKLVGHCSVNDEIVAKGIEAALMTVSYDKNAKIDPYTHSYFKIYDSTSSFKFTKIEDKVFRYYVGGNKKPSIDAPVMTITPFTITAPMNDKDIKKTMEGIYKSEGMTSIKVKNESDDKINGYPAYQSEVYGKLNGKPTMIYQVTIFDNGNALLLMGVTVADMDTNLAEFKKLTYTVNFIEPKDGK